MKKITLLLFIFNTVAFATTPPEGFTSLFNGKDLTGWWGAQDRRSKQMAISPAGKVQS